MLFNQNSLNWEYRQQKTKNMQKQNQSQISHQNLIQQLREFGFEQSHILKALQYTNSKELAAEIIVKIIQQGPNVDLSMYKQVQPVLSENKLQQEKLPEYNKPIRPKMIFIVNGQLKMGKGKICAQVAHAVIGGYLQIEEQAKYDEVAANRLKAWESSGSPKIVVKCPTEKEMLQIQKKINNLKLGINTYLVEDAGHTQIKAGSKTILGIGPAFSNQIDPFTEHLKLA